MESFISESFKRLLALRTVRSSFPHKSLELSSESSDGKKKSSESSGGSSLKKQIVLKVAGINGESKKYRAKVLRLVVGLQGVESVALTSNDKSILIVTGEVDPVQIVILLRKKVGFAELLSVEMMEKKEMPTEEPKKTEEKKIESISVDAFSSCLESPNCPKVLTEMPKEEEWNAQEIRAIVDELSVLPESPNCPFLLQLSLEGSYALTAIPSSFFEHMPVLQHLNLSRTSIKSLPASIPKLVELKTLILRNCKLFLELPPQIGELHNLEELDLDETQILLLPNEVRKLSNLKFLRVSFFGYMNWGKRLSQSALIHPGTIAALSQLTELSIDANPDDERWSAVVEAVIEEACSLKRLECLILYLPNVESLGKLRICSASLYLHKFRFIVGHHRQRSISRVPEEAHAQFQKWDKCLKFVKGKDIPNEMKGVLRYTEAFYLDHHATASSLCDFGIENIWPLKFCLLVECNEIQTIIGGVESNKEGADMLEYGPNTLWNVEYSPNSPESGGGSTTLWSETETFTSDLDSDDEPDDMLEDDLNNSEFGGWSNYTTQSAFLNLQYLYIYYLKNLMSLCGIRIVNKLCLSGLKFLKLHMCPKLSVIFHPTLLANLSKLEVLIVKDCPEVTSVVSLTANEFVDPRVLYLPSLKRMSLLYLPKLVSISSGVRIAPKLEKIGFYTCPKLESLSTGEMSSGDLEMIKGESKWWEALKWNKSEWGNRLNYLQSIFCPITRERDVMTQMEEISQIPSRDQTRMVI